jgi:hypothetical protein
MLTIEQIRQVVRQELGKGEGPAAEFKEICAIEYGDSGEPLDYERDRVSYCQATDDFTKLFEPDGQELQKLSRSRMAPTRNAPPEDKPADDESCEAFFDCKVEKRASASGKIRLTKRMVDGELLIEGFDHEGSCVYTRVVAAGDELGESEQPLVKSEIMSQMNKTRLRNSTRIATGNFSGKRKTPTNQLPRQSKLPSRSRNRPHQASASTTFTTSRLG